MEIDFNIAFCSYWQFADSPDASDSVVELDKKGWPKLDFLPAMQRRRLTPFMKMALHTAYDACAQWQQQHPDCTASFATVFSSRHGDLSQTSKMLEQLADQEEISPTAFSLSVHNAVAGLYSILSQNKAASTTVAAGKGTLTAALIESILRAQSSQQPVLLVHTEQVIPPLYADFADEEQKSHSLALIITCDAEKPYQLTLHNADNAALNAGATGFDQWFASPHQPLLLPFNAQAVALRKQCQPG